MTPTPQALVDLKPFEGSVWRLLFEHQKQHLLDPVPSPEGRFHHSKQKALYTSLSPEGTRVATKRYIKPDDPKRCLVQLHLKACRIMDLRLLPDPTQASVVWQDSRAAGQSAPTWQFSDAARAAQAQGLLYPSRSRPDLTHLVLFQWNCDGGAQIFEK